MQRISIFIFLFVSSSSMSEIVRGDDYSPFISGNEIDGLFRGIDERSSIDEDLTPNHIQDDQFMDIPLGIPEEEKDVPGEPLTPEDFANARTIEILSPVMDENSPDPIQAAGLFEGDIAGVNITDLDINPDGRNAIRDMRLRWSGGVIPYVISAAFNSYERSVIAAAFADYHQRTCVRFVPRTRERDYIYIVKGTGCSSQVGRVGNGQNVILGHGCVYKGVIIHELMHAAGFWHEQSRTDRDNYVTVLWHNILPGMEYNFNKFDWNTVQSLGVPYDTESVMHYTRFSFSRDGRSPTILPKDPQAKLMGQRTGFSNIDLKKINILYKCNEFVKPTVVKPTEEKGNCVNNHRLCDYWAKINECAKNPSWMLVNCRKSCNQCGFQCNNYHKNCEYWAGIGECTKNPSYMTIYCPKSCNTCHNAGHSQSAGCVDHNKHCPAWAKDNQCSVNPRYMLVHCQLSCKQC